MGLESLLALVIFGLPFISVMLAYKIVSGSDWSKTFWFALIFSGFQAVFEIIGLLVFSHFFVAGLSDARFSIGMLGFEVLVWWFISTKMSLFSSRLKKYEVDRWASLLIYSTLIKMGMILLLGAALLDLAYEPMSMLSFIPL